MNSTSNRLEAAAGAIKCVYRDGYREITCADGLRVRGNGKIHIDQGPLIKTACEQTVKVTTQSPPFSRDDWAQTRRHISARYGPALRMINYRFPELHCCSHHQVSD
jgi:hypothetical protein